MRIDAHLHFWRPDCGFDNRPVADHEAYRRDFLPVHVKPDLDACGIDGVILVQTCPQREETQWLLDLVADEPRVLGVTAWVDLDTPDLDFGTVARNSRIVGIRAQLRRITDDAFVARPHVVANLGNAMRAGLNVTILAEARHYGHVTKVLQQLPPGPVTLNHLGLPFPAIERNAWRAFVRSFAARPASFVQLSGLPFLYAEAWRTREAHALLDEALDLLGPDRLLFASDWPMLLRFATYREWVSAVEAFMHERGLDSSAREAIFGGNAFRANPRLSNSAIPRGTTRAAALQ